MHSSVRLAQSASVGLQEGRWPDSPEGFLLIHITRSSVRLLIGVMLSGVGVGWLVLYSCSSVSGVGFSSTLVHLLTDGGGAAPGFVENTQKSRVLTNHVNHQKEI